jgi:hypothetical protein
VKIVILNGNPEPGQGRLDSYVAGLAEELARRGHAAAVEPLRDMSIKYCTGCWGCWVRTPGECVIPDDTVGLRDRIVNSDLVIHASPVVMGFISSLLKRVVDKTIPLLHPYVTFIAGEAHHRKRYDRYPLTGVILDRRPDTDDEDIDIIAGVYRRNMLNLYSRLLFVRDTAAPEGAIADEIDRH